jgi:hypothetical protein
LSRWTCHGRASNAAVPGLSAFAISVAHEEQAPARARGDGNKQGGACLAGLLRDVEILNQESLHLALAMAPPPSGFGRLWAQLEQEVVKDGGSGDDFLHAVKDNFSMCA